MVQGLHIRNAQIWDGNGVRQRNLYTTYVVVDSPISGSLTVDLEGYTIFPGLINAHDHLELNHYPRTKFRERYENARQWSADVNERLDSEPYKSLRAYPLEDRCFIGGLKNLLCGATTVAHHNPPHKCLFRKDFPVRVLKKYGWAHSLYLSSEEEIVRSYRSTPKDVPWFIHLAEGTDAEAAGEYQRLKAMGCVGQNTVIVHGVGLRGDDAQKAHNLHAKLVLCPSTNLYLLGKTISSMSTFMSSSLLLGSDSRLTADGDFLDEIRCFRHLFPDIPGKLAGLFNSITFWAECNLGLRRRRSNQWDSGIHADFIALRVDYETELPAPIFNAHRADLALVVKGGVPQIGNPDVMAKFPHIQTVDAILDGKPKSIHLHLAQRIHHCTLKEPGLEVDALPRRNFRLW